VCPLGGQSAHRVAAGEDGRLGATVALLRQGGRVAGFALTLPTSTGGGHIAATAPLRW